MPPKPRVSRIKSTSKHVSEVVGWLLTWRRLRHASDRLAKTENVMEKYKKKLQEGADLRQHVKVCLLVGYKYVRLADPYSRWKNKMQISSTRTRLWKKSTAR
jgi:hypothetical protein